MMKFHLALLVAATALADSVTPLVFFAKVNETFELLHRKTKFIFTPEPGTVGAFYNEHSSSEPVYFSMKEGQIFTEDEKYPGYAGISGNQLVFGLSGPDKNLNFDKNMRLKDHHAVSCKWTSHYEREIVLDIGNDYRCYDVEVYLLPYNKTSKTYVEGSYVPEKALAESKENKAEDSYVFFANVNSIMKPLSREGNSDFYVFSHEKPRDPPIEFTLRNGTAFSKTSVPAYAGFDEEYFGFGTMIKETQFDFEENMRVKGHTFFSCRLPFTPIQMILTAIKDHENCFKAEIYLLPFNKTSGSYMEGSYVPKTHVPLNKKHMVGSVGA